MNEMEKLKPCPFCGCTEIEQTKIKETGEWYLKCSECYIEQPLYPTLWESRDAWNRRTDNA